YSIYCFYFFCCCVDLLFLHFFPTRRSSDLLLISLAMILIVSDVRYMLIPNNILLSFLPLFIVLRIIHPLDPWWSSITGAVGGFLDRKSTRLNSSHVSISYAVFCLKKQRQ